MKGRKKIGYWKKERDDKLSTTWRNTVNSYLTMEVHKLEDRELGGLGKARYHAFLAKNGKGIPHSPEELFTKKKEAIDYAKEHMRNWSLNGMEKGWQKNYWSGVKW